MQYEYKRNVNWNKDLEIGKLGEDRFTNFMLRFGYDVKDTSRIPEYQAIDVDFKVTNTKGINKLYEVKRDKTLAKFGYEKRRLCIEDISSVKDKFGNVVYTDGWFRKCKSDYIIIDGCDNEMYMYQLDDIKEYISYYRLDSNRVIYYQLGNCMMFGVYQKKFDRWLIENNKVCKVFYLDSNICMSRNNKLTNK